MNSCCFFINIHCIVVTKKNRDLQHSLLTELTIHLGKFYELENFRVIPLQANTNPILLIIVPYSQQFQADNITGAATFDNIQTNATGFVENRYKWKQGKGFNLCTSIIGNESTKPKIRITNNHLIDKYLEALSSFNKAYEDDLFLNLSVIFTSFNYFPLGSRIS